MYKGTRVAVEVFEVVWGQKNFCRGIYFRIPVGGTTVGSLTLACTLRDTALVQLIEI